MALKLTVESFLQVVRQSGLIEKEQLQKLLQSFAERGIDVSKSQPVADALVNDEVITRWQADKLMAGKHKGFFLGKYKLLDLLGKGGMSSVYLAEHVLMKRRCAIKVLPAKRVHDSSYLARFHREAQAVASVDHPNIVRAYDVDCAQDRDSQIHFLVMEYVNGQSLQELIIRNGPADYADAVEYIRQSAEGLEHAHRAGLVHRDIKPANLLIDSNGTIKILDMGLARFFDDREENPLTVAHDEKVLGTADYLAPEQALDSHSVDTRADLYSLGCSLYFFLTGKPPFTEGTLTQRLMWHQTKAFPPLTDSRIDCPASLSALLSKMVEKKPEDRFQSAAEVAQACRQWLVENAGADWKQHHVASIRATPPTSSGRLMSPTRDLQSDTALQKASSHVMGSTLQPRDEEGSAATKISRPANAPPEPATAITTPPAIVPTVTVVPLSAPSVSPPTAVPVVAPSIAAKVVPPVAAPVVQPIAAPLPPVARPVAPMAMPVAAPIVAAPVARPVAAASVTPTVQHTEPESSPFDFTTETEAAKPIELAPEFLFGNTAAEPETTVAPTPSEDVAESADEGNLFSLFGGESTEPPAVEPTVSVPVAAPVEPAAVEPAVAEPTVAFESSSDDAPEAAEFSFESSGPAVVAESAKPEPKPAAKPRANPFQKPAVKYGTLAAVAVVLIGGGIWWSTRGAASSGKATAKTTKKDKSSKSLSNGTSGTKKSDAHEVTLLVGAGGEFKSIARALYSAVESRAEHEQAANGKPLRFIISVKPGGQPFEEAIVLDESFPGEVHLKSDTPGKNVTLTPPSNTEPAITIKNRSDVTIENITIDMAGFPQKEKAIVITGTTSRCRVKNCVLSDVGKVGIELNGASGGEGADGIVLEGITVQKASPTAFGVHVSKPADGTPTQRVTVQRCRFFGSMGSGVFVEGTVESLTIRNCGATGTTSGIRFAAGVVAKNVLVDHCSFRNHVEAGLLFDGMPGDGSTGLAWRNCLFSGASKAELLIAKGYDGNKFNLVMSADKPVENNWSDRKEANTINGERDLLGHGGSRVTSIQFESTAVNAELFLVAKAGEPYKAAGIKAK